MTNESPYSQLNLLSNEASCDAFAHVSESQVIEKAWDILAERIIQADALTNPSAVTQYLVAQFAGWNTRSLRSCYWILGTECFVTKNFSGEQLTAAQYIPAR